MAGGGSKPGEHRGGRKLGTPNRVTAGLAAAARVHTEAALAALVHVMDDEDAPAAARVAAAGAILDRGHGKPRQMTEHRNVIDLTKLTLEELLAHHDLNAVTIINSASSFLMAQAFPI